MTSRYNFTNDASAGLNSDEVLEQSLPGFISTHQKDSRRVFRRYCLYVRLANEMSWPCVKLYTSVTLETEVTLKQVEPFQNTTVTFLYVFICLQILSSEACHVNWMFQSFRNCVFI